MVRGSPPRKPLDQAGTQRNDAARAGTQRNETGSFGKFRKESERFGPKLKSTSLWGTMPSRFFATNNANKEEKTESCNKTLKPGLEQSVRRTRRERPGKVGNHAEPDGTERNKTESFGKFRKVPERNGTFRDGSGIRKSFGIRALSVRRPEGQGSDFPHSALRTSHSLIRFSIAPGAHT